MRKSIQFSVLVFSMLILVSYQNCGQAPIGSGEWGSYEGGSSSSSFGSFFLIVNPNVAVTPDTKSVQIAGECNPGRSVETRIEWTLYPGNNYSGLRNGVTQGCIGQYFDFSIILADDFDYSAGNSLMLRYIVANESGQEEKRDYYINLVEGVIKEDDISHNCDSPGTISNTTAPCIITGALPRTSQGFAGISIKAKVRPNTTKITSNTSKYPIIHVTDESLSPYFSYSTGKTENSSSDYTFEWLHLYDDKFPYNVHDVNTPGKLSVKDPDDDKEDKDYIWLAGKTYTVEISYSKYYSAWGSGFVHLKVCESGKDICTINNKYYQNLPVPYVFGSEGLALVFGTPSSISDRTDESFINISGWSITDVSVKVCGSDYLSPTYKSGGRCFQ
jgi:hypothetical protein